MLQIVNEHNLDNFMNHFDNRNLAIGADLVMLTFFVMSFFDSNAYT